MRKRTIIGNAMVLTMDSEFRFFENGAVVVEDDKIADVGNQDDIFKKYNQTDHKFINARGKLIMPGLINAHTHIPMTIFRGYADDLALHEWLYDYIFPVESKFATAENVRTGSELAVAEMIRCGTTTFNDMYYFADVIAEVCDKSGMRAFISEAVICFPAPNSPTPKNGLENGEFLMNKWNAHPRITLTAASHSPYSCSGEYIYLAKELADKFNVPFNIHLAETKKEFDDSIKEHGMTPVEYLDDLGVLGENTIAAHGVHLTEKDIETLSNRGVSVVHNPECNMKLASGVAPVSKLLQAGVKIALGTDGVASNNNMDLFEEMNTTAILHKLSEQNPTVMNAQTVVELCTIRGAEVLGVKDQIGSLQKGKKADVIIIDLEQPHALPVYNIYSLIVYSLQGRDVESVMINGEWVMQQRQLTHINEEKVFENTRRIARSIRAQHPGVQPPFE